MEVVYSQELPASLNTGDGNGGPSKSPPNKKDRRVNQGAAKVPMLLSQGNAEITPRFLIVKRREGDFSKVSPFLIEKVLSGLVGNVKSVKKNKEGLLIETNNPNQTKKLLKQTKFHEFDIEVTPHAFLNYSKGVITCRDLLNCTVEEIMDNLKDQGIINVKRISTKRDGIVTDTASLILTFNSPKLPEKVKAGIYHSLSVRPYIPAPMRCFNCQKFGHTTQSCDKEPICICGKALHQGESCTDPIICVNCNGEHSARSKNCPIFKEEAAIQRIKTLEKIPYNEAKKRVKTNASPTSGSYAKITSTAPPTQAPNIKDIILQMIPEITKICTTLIEQKISNHQPNTVINQTRKMPPPDKVYNTRSSNQSYVSDSSTQSKDKRKASKSPTDTSEESDVSQPSESDKTIKNKNKKSKPGWPKGKPRSSQGQNIKIPDDPAEKSQDLPAD